jgi:hypothetical protein
VATETLRVTPALIASISVLIPALATAVIGCIAAVKRQQSNVITPAGVNQAHGVDEPAKSAIGTVATVV